MAWGWNFGSPEWRPAMILGMSYIFGNDPDLLAFVSGYDAATCSNVLANCRKNGVWRGDKIRCRAWEKEGSEFAFLLDAMVVGGFISRKTRTEEQEKAAAERRRLLVESGLCANCGKRNDRDKKTCSACSSAVKASQLKRKQVLSTRTTFRAPKVVDTEGFYYLNDKQREEVEVRLSEVKR